MGNGLRFKDAIARLTALARPEMARLPSKPARWIASDALRELKEKAALGSLTCKGESAGRPSLKDASPQ
jgi:hypothetical protein